MLVGSPQLTFRKLLPTLSLSLAMLAGRVSIASAQEPGAPTVAINATTGGTLSNQQIAAEW